MTGRSTITRAGASSSTRAGRSDEAGAGVVDTFVGFTIFLICLLFAAQVMVRLYAQSSLESAAERAAETVARAPNPPAAVNGAEQQARTELGGFGARDATFDWVEVDSNAIVLRVSGVAPGFLPGPASWRSISRTVTVRTGAYR